MSVIELLLTNQTYNTLGLHYFPEVRENRAQAGFQISIISAFTTFIHSRYP